VVNILFIGGTGIISSACVQAALDRGWRVTVLNRGRSGPPPDGCRHLCADVRDRDRARDALAGARFDAVLDFMAFVPEHVETGIALFRERCGQYVFISSASAYQTPPGRLPVTEDTPLDNPFWAYSRDKIACERRLLEEAARGFPVTIVRPSHTYGRQRFPFDGGYTALDRIRRGKPVVLPGDGTSVWTLTHARDFAVGLLGLLGQPAALGEAFHITNDEWLTWNGIFETLGRHLGREPVLAHLPSAAVARADAQLGAGWLGDKAHSMIFDNAKLRRLVPAFRPAIPFAEGARDIVDWYEEDPARQVIDPAFDALQDRLAALHGRLLDLARG
jgi:nucleoside-diphosphate-sugar epimerase